MHEEITFTVEFGPESGGFVARGEDPQVGGITTHRDSLGDLQVMITDVVGGCLETRGASVLAKVHFAGSSVQ